MKSQFFKDQTKKFSNGPWAIAKARNNHIVQIIININDKSLK